VRNSSSILALSQDARLAIIEAVQANRVRDPARNSPETDLPRSAAIKTPYLI
jgi:hypothetical protein